MSCGLHSLNGVIKGSTIGVIQVHTRSVDYSSYALTPSKSSNKGKWEDSFENLHVASRSRRVCASYVSGFPGLGLMEYRDFLRLYMDN